MGLEESLFFSQQQKEKEKKRREKEEREKRRSREKKEEEKKDMGFGLLASMYGEEYAEGYRNGQAFGEAAVSAFGEVLEERMAPVNVAAKLGTKAVKSLFEEDGEEEPEMERSEKFFKTEDGKVSNMDLVKELALEEEGDGPFKKLAKKLNKKNEADEDSEEALEEFAKDAAKLVLREVKEEMERRKELDERGEEITTEEQERQAKFDRSMGKKLTVLKNVMGEDELYDLLDDMDELGYGVSPDALLGYSIFDMKKEKAGIGLKKLEEHLSGQTPGFFKVLGAIGKYIGLEEGQNADLAEKDLEESLESFVLNDCGPTKRDVDPEVFNTAMYLLGALKPEGEFASFVGKVNSQPGRGVKYDPEDFMEEPKLQSPAKEIGLEGPVLKMPMPWEM